MYKYLLICFFVATSHSLFAQDAIMYETATKAFQEHFNAQNIDGVFDLYAVSLQEEMTKEGTTQFINGCHAQFGKLNMLTFIETAEGINSYTAVFEKMDLVMEIQLDADGKISTIQFQEP